MVTIVAGLIGCTSDSGMNAILGCPCPSGIVITVGDSDGIAGFRPALDTAAEGDTVMFTVPAGTPDTFDVVWSAAPAGGTAPPNSGALTAGSSYAAKFSTAGSYEYMDTFHHNVNGAIFVENPDNYGQRVRK